MLCCSSDATLSMYDLDDEPTKKNRKIDAIAYEQRSIGEGANKTQGHSKFITSAQWFPGDTGMFLTSSRDASVMVYAYYRALVKVVVKGHSHTPSSFVDLGYKLLL